MTDYNALCARLEALVASVPYPIANLANASALLYEGLADINWAGFYIIEDGKLVLGPFQGKPACIVIPKGKGVCGTAWSAEEAQLVRNVHDFPGHIACDSASNSEIVVPLYKEGAVIGVMDIDSPLLSRFDEDDRRGLETFARILEKSI